MATQVLERPVIANKEQHRRVWALFSSILSRPQADDKPVESITVDQAQSKYVKQLLGSMGLDHI
ncbi:MAG: hypothetical protein ACE5Q6_09550 [Dehalococcoidia bacterium]